MAVGDNVQIRFGADVAAAVAGIQQVGTNLTGLAGRASMVGNAFNALKAQLLATLGPLLLIFEVGKAINLVEQAAQASLQMQNFANNTGIARGEIVTLGRELVLMGGEASSAQAGIARLERAFGQAQNGNRNLVDTFHRLGVEVSASMTPTQALQQTIAGFQRLQAGPQKLQMEFQLFRFQAQALAPILNANQNQMRTLHDTMDRLATGPLPNLVANLNDLAFENNAVTYGQNMLKNVLADAMAPALASISSAFRSLIEDFITSYREGGTARDTMDTLANSLKVLATVVLVLVAAIEIGITLIAAFVRATVDAGRALADAAHGDFASASREMARHNADMEAGLRRSGDTAIATMHALDALWNHTPTNMAAGGGTGDQTDEARHVAAERLQIQMAQYALEQQLARDNFDQVMAIENQKVDAIRRFYGEESKEYIDAQRARLNMQQAHDALELANAQHQAEQLTKIAVDHVNAQDQVEQVSFDRREAELQEQLANFQITEQQKADLEAQLTADRIAAEQALANRIFQIQLQGLQDRLAMDGLTIQARLDLNAQIEALEAQHEDRMTELHAQGAERQRQVDVVAQNVQRNGWREVWTSMEQTFSQTISGLIERTTSWADAFMQIQNMLIQKFVEWAVKVVMEHIWMEQTRTAATAVSATTRTAIGATATATGLAQSAMLALGDIANSAMRAAAGAYAAIAGIPFVGPVLAPMAAMAALAAVLALGKSLVSARGGMGDVPYDGMLAQLHKNEMVLPASIASPLRSQLSRGGDGGVFGDHAKAGDTHIHNWNIQAMDAQSFGRFLKANGDQLVKALINQERGFAAVSTGYAR